MAGDAQGDCAASDARSLVVVPGVPSIPIPGERARPWRHRSGLRLTRSSRDAAEIERAIESFARGPNGGLSCRGMSDFPHHRDLVLTLAAHKLSPSVVLSFGSCRRRPNVLWTKSDRPVWADAGYVDRILNGANPADLPVQTPTKYEMVQSQNRKGARPHRPAGRDSRADEVIE